MTSASQMSVRDLYLGPRSKRKVIVTCAVTGENEFNRAHPAFPITPAQIADAALEAERAGASAVHLHVRDPKTGEGSRDPELFAEMVAAVRARGVRAVLNVTCGGGAIFVPDAQDESRAASGTDMASWQERVQHIEATLPELCSLDVTTQNQDDGLLGDIVYLNTPRTLRSMAQRFAQIGVKPEIEVFAPGDVLLARQILEEGGFATPPLFQIVLGTKWGLPATPETLIYMRGLLPAGCVWAAFAIGRMQMPLVAQSVLLGGNVRVGLEDNLYLDRGAFATNGQLVERAVQIIRAIGEEVATPDEARTLLGVRAR
jgi:uncharacterized protein (DUF849 family)